jgi:hypothetical protein
MLLSGRKRVLWTLVIVCAIFGTLIGCVLFSAPITGTTNADKKQMLLQPWLLHANFAVWGCLVSVVVDICMDFFVRTKRNIYFIERCLLALASCAPLLVINCFTQSEQFLEIFILCVGYQAMMSMGVYSAVLIEATSSNRLFECACFAMYCIGLSAVAVAVTGSRKNTREIVSFIGIGFGGAYFLHFLLMFGYYILLSKYGHSQKYALGKLHVNWRVSLSSLIVFILGSFSFLVLLSVASNYVDSCATAFVAIYFVVLAVSNAVFVIFVGSVRFDIDGQAAKAVNTEFVRYVSHEIRTPLNVASIGMELISGDAVPGSTISSLSVQVHQALSDAHNVLQNIMDHEELSTGRITPVKATVSALDSLKGAVDAAVLKMDFATEALPSSPGPSIIEFSNNLIDDFTTIHVDESLIMKAVVSAIMSAVSAGGYSEKVYVTLSNVESWIVVNIANRMRSLTDKSTEMRTFVTFDDEFNFCLFPGSYNPQHDLGLHVAKKFVVFNGGEFTVSYVVNHGKSNSSGTSNITAAGARSAKLSAKTNSASIDLLCTITLPVRDFSSHAQSSLDDDPPGGDHVGTLSSFSISSAKPGHSKKKFSINARIHSEVHNKPTLDSVPEGLAESRSSSMRSSKTNGSGDKEKERDNAQRPVEPLRLWKEPYVPPSGTFQGKTPYNMSKVVVRRNMTEFTTSSSGSGDKHDDYLPSTVRTFSSSKQTTPDTSTKESSSVLPSARHRSQDVTPRNELSADKTPEHRESDDFVHGGQSDKQDQIRSYSAADDDNSSVKSTDSPLAHAKFVRSGLSKVSEAGSTYSGDEANTSNKSSNTNAGNIHSNSSSKSNNTSGASSNKNTDREAVVVSSDMEGNVKWMVGKKMLVIAPSMEHRNELCLKLAQLGAAASAAVDLEDAASKLSVSRLSDKGGVGVDYSDEFDAVFVEYEFPNGENGPLICKRFRGLGYRRPIVGLLDAENTGRATEFFSKGCTVVFVKPVQMELVKKALEPVNL